MNDHCSTSWWVYLVLTDSDQLYTGIAKNPERRFEEHLATYEGRGKKGAKFFRGHKPIKIVYREAAENRSEATRREIAIKKLPPVKKRALTTSLKDQVSTPLK